jgi:hypothetical protein
MACEAFPIQMFSPGSTTQFKNMIPRKQTSRNCFEGDYLSISKHGRHSVDSHESVWANILRCYTAANLTNSNDTELALSGIIKVLKVKFSDQYTAGLWTEILPFQFVWVLQGPTLPRDTKPPYCAPSWSCKSHAVCSFSSLSVVVYSLTHLKVIYK